MQAEGEEIMGLPSRATGSLEFSTFYAEEHEHLFKALYFVTGHRADAHDLMQDAFLKLWERWDSIDRIDDPTAYLFRVALNGSRMRARAARRSAKRLMAMDAPVDAFDEVNMREDVRHLLLSLAPRKRAALVLLDLYGYGSEEAARIMGVRPSTVRALATKARVVLRSAGGSDG